MGYLKNTRPPAAQPSRVFFWLIVGVVILIAFFTAMSLAIRPAKAHEIPFSCISLAERERHPLPTNKSEAKLARVKLLWLKAKGDALANECYRALKEMRAIYGAP